MIRNGLELPQSFEALVRFVVGVAAPADLCASVLYVRVLASDRRRPPLRDPVAEVGALLETVVIHPDLVARTGRREFAVLLVGAHPPVLDEEVQRILRPSIRSVPLAAALAHADRRHPATALQLFKRARRSARRVPAPGAREVDLTTARPEVIDLTDSPAAPARTSDPTARH